jgi:hypothetical protein
MNWTWQVVQPIRKQSVFMVPTSPICNQQNSINLLANSTVLAFLFGDSMTCHFLVEAFTIIRHNMSHCACNMFWHVHVHTSCSSLFHITHLLILVAPLHTHNSHCPCAVSPSQGIHCTPANQRHWLVKQVIKVNGQRKNVNLWGCIYQRNRTRYCKINLLYCYKMSVFHTATALGTCVFSLQNKFIYKQHAICPCEMHL